MAGGWTNDAQDEITAPGSVPFLPGNDVVGIGITLPGELVAAGYKNAIVFYSNTWNPAATIPTIKFRFIATNPISGDLILGYGLVINPSVSQTAIVTTGLDLGTGIGANELVAPSGVTFAPGNTAVGIGTTLPPELVSAGYTVALVFYSTSWNPAATTPTVKFKFLAIGSFDTTVLGYGICANPSVSQTAVVVTGLSLGVFDQAGSSLSVNYSSGNQALTFTEVSGSPLLQIYHDAVAANVGFIVDVTDASGSAELILGSSTGNALLQLAQSFLIGLTGSFSKFIQVSDSSLSNTASLINDLGWTAVPLVNGWLSDVARPAQYRMMADGTCQMKGFINKAANPVNGEAWMSGLPSLYVPLHTWSFLTATPGRPANTGQIVEVRNNGTGIIFDMAALPGSIALDTVRYTALY